MSSKQRCVNLDWVEFYCLESGQGFPHDAEYFRDHGFMVRERAYGTRQYEQMFTVLDKDDHGFVEIRRKPVSGALAERVKGIFSPYSCHIKLCNRWCYADNAMTVFCDFLNEHGYEIQRIFRLDICLDFEKFDRGDDPYDFLRRYMKGRYTKVNQGHVAAHGNDTWESREWNSLSWGAKKSMVNAKFYNKTLELKEVKDKPYIRYAWFKSGLVDDYTTLQKKRANGSTYHPDIWRVEFSINSSAKGWFLVEDNNGRKTKTLAMEHWPATYSTKDLQLKAFEQLANHYFHFKIFEKDKRKDRCEDKILFDFGQNHTPYTLDRLMTDTPADKSADALKKRIESYRLTHPQEDVRKACDIILQQLKQESIKHSMTNPYDRTELQLLQELIARRMDLPWETLEQSAAIVKQMISLESDLFL